MKKVLLSTTIAIFLIISMVSSVLASEFVFKEAETGVLGQMIVEQDAQAYGGEYITSDDLEQSALFNIEIPQNGTYTVWFRVYATMDTDNSIFFSIDDDSYSDSSLWIFDYREPSEYEINPDDTYVDPNYNNPDMCYDNWYWLRMSFRDANGSPVTRFNTKFYELTAGTHTLRIQSREAGARIDKIIFTDDLAYNPNNVEGDPEAAYLAEKAAQESEEPTNPEPTEETPSVPEKAPKTSDSLNMFIIIFAASALSVIVAVKKRRVNQ